MKKKLLKFVLLISVIVGMFAAMTITASAEVSGTCGDDLTWTYVEEMLIIDGTGDMWDYNSDDAQTPWYDLSSFIRTIIIKDEVTSIGNSAFDSCDRLTNLTFGSNVKEIGAYAFSDCIELESVTIPDSVKMIGKFAFSSCNKLTSVTTGDGVVTIGNYAFDNCDSLTNLTIGDSVETIGEAAFYSCDSLTNVTIPASVTTIGQWAFRLCGLISITVDDGNTYFSSDENGVLFDKNKTKLILYPEGNQRTSYKIPEGVMSIGEYAFDSCKFLQNVTIADSMTEIGESAFANCNSLKNITIPSNIKTIGVCAFFGCENLEKVIILDGVEKIEGNAFGGGCNLLYFVIIPNSVTMIGNYAFEWCDALTTVAYGGTEKQWSEISIGWCNEDLENANIIYMDLNPMRISSISKRNIDIVSGKLTGTISLGIFNVADDTDVKVMAAVYDLNGNYIGMTSENITVSSGHKYVTIDLSVPVSDDVQNGQIKIFLWKGLSDITPYSRCDGFGF